MSASGIAVPAGRVASVCAWLCVLLSRFASVCVWHLISVAAVCPRFMLSVAVRLSHLPSTRVRHCSSIGQVTSVCAWLCVLLSRFASVCVWHLISVAAVCPRSTPGAVLLSQRFPRRARPLRFCCGVLPSVHACCLPHGDKQDGLRYLAFLFRRSRSPSSVLAVSFGYLPWLVHFGFCRLFAAISTGMLETRRTELRGLAARPLCAFAQSHWL